MMRGFNLGHVKDEDTFDARQFRYTSLQSQYDDLDGATFAQIEEAAMCCHLRDFQAASCILDALPLEIRQHPAIVYERSQILWLDWSLFKCESVLEGGIVWGKDHIPDSAKPGIYALLRIALGRVRAMTRGDLTDGRNALREVRGWLLDVPIEEYTDVQVKFLIFLTYCICIYYHLLHFLGNVTNDFDKDFFKVIPAVVKSNGWATLRRLREYKQMQGRLLEARVVLDQELCHTPDASEQEKACKSLLEACINQKASTEPIWWISGRSKLRLGQILLAGSKVQAHDIDGFQGAKCALEAARAHACENNTLLLVRQAELDCTNKSGHQDALKAYDEFVQHASVQKDNYIYSTTLSRACSIALAQLEGKSCPANAKIFWQWNRKAESLLRQLGDIAYLLIFHLATGDIACKLEGDIGSILQWHEEFQMSYPSYSLWRQKTAVGKTKLLIYNRLNDRDNILRTLSEMQCVAAAQDTFWDEDGFKKQAAIKASSSDRKSDMTSGPAAFQNWDPEMDWLLEWSTEMPVFMNTGWKRVAVQVEPDSVKASSILEVHLCSWMKEEFHAGVLTQQDTTDILSFDSVGDADTLQVTKSIKKISIDRTEPAEQARSAINTVASNLERSPSSTFEDTITSLTPETTSRRVFGTSAAPTSKIRWEKAYSALSDWLLQKSTRSEARRHFLLYQIQNRRLSNVIHAATSYELRALEAERLIILLPKLNAKVQAQIASDLAYWRSILAAAKHMMYVKSLGDVLRDMHSPEVKEILELYDQSLVDNHEKNGPLTRDIHINMDIAHVYFYAAARMDPIAVEGLLNAVARAVQTFEKIRAGWRALKGWDRVEKLLLALEERRILQIAPTIVTVICQVPDDRREARDKMIWDMIQFAKSIGISWLMESNAADLREKKADGKNDSGHSGNKDAGLQDKSRMTSDPEEYPSTQLRATLDSHDNQRADEKLEIARVDAAKAAESGEKQASTSLDTDQLQADLQSINHFGSDTVFVDWYNSACGLADSPRPVVTTLSGTNEAPRCSVASITWKQVNEVVNQFMELETEDLQDEDSTEFLYQLNPLVEPLAWTKPGQTLVLSPCGNLHRIPLHALKINGEVIIKRNPVVYCSSLSALASAYRLRIPWEAQSSTRLKPDATAKEIPDSFPAEYLSFKVSLFGDPPSKVGQAALTSTASKFKTIPQIGPNFTASSFTRTLQDPDLTLLHYHGHADFSPTAPTDHCLLFSDRDLTLRDIFDLPSPLSHGRGFHVTLLGCGSGMSKTGPTDDVIGLVPSLLYAGAASTVSTLWKFLDGDAASYSEAFYEDFFGGRAESGGVGTVGDGVRGEAGEVVVDLAKANQKAVLSIMRKRPALYHWASFVLNGYWMMRMPLGK
ncbi:uncharacterized protein KY384_009200 [Bacidia gigantensis]|uniref:uncharacterized protein n=1 Tax=Bacidia gigantensis TaxID=2732470 RepID=UPI001D03996C|nr:uncharacterized protein KY384_009200 [Bacidia gigantensis]KAG8525556.1 hypothetical protein KY384_009200 [Bacidia gigantensis]